MCIHVGSSCDSLSLPDVLQQPTAPVLKAGHLVSYLFMCKCVVCLVCVLGWMGGGG